MDVLYHAAVGAVIAHASGNPLHPAIIASSVLPDIAGVLPFWYYKIRDAKIQTGTVWTRHALTGLLSNEFESSVDAALYRLFHSLITACIFMAAVSVIAADIWIPAGVAYLSHILIDIPTHSGDFATRILYPVSDLHIPARNWAKSPALFLAFWVLLAGVWALS